VAEKKRVKERVRNVGDGEDERLAVVVDDEGSVVTERTGIRWERQKYQIRTEIILVNQFSKFG
jgi:hypothetical protein